MLLCALLWSTSGFLIKLTSWHPALIAGGRCMLAAAVLLALRFFSREPKVGWRKIPLLFVSGICYAVTMILFVIANKLTASANAIMLQYTAPIWTCLLSWLFLREKPHWEHWTALAMVGAGMFLVFRSGLAAGSLLGDSIALVSGFAFGASSVVMRAKKDGSPADIMISAHLITAAFAIPFFIMYPPAMTAGNIISIFFMGIIQIGLASALFVYGIRRVTAVQAVLITTIEAVMNPLWVLLVTGERPTTSVIAGGSMIVAAVIFSSVAGRRR